MFCIKIIINRFQIKTVYKIKINENYCGTCSCIQYRPHNLHWTIAYVIKRKGCYDRLCSSNGWFSRTFFDARIESWSSNYTSRWYPRGFENWLINGWYGTYQCNKLKEIDSIREWLNGMQPLKIWRETWSRLILKMQITIEPLVNCQLTLLILQNKFHHSLNKWTLLCQKNNNWSIKELKRLLYSR